jgi:hypothetical protein
MTGRLLGGAGAITAASLLLGACGTDGGGAAVTPPQSTSASAGSQGAAQAAETLRRVGLTLPSSASDVRVQPTTVPDMTDGALVTFRAPASSATVLCSQSGMGGALVAAALTSTQQAALQTESAPGGSHVCGGGVPTDVSWNRFVLIGPGDPADVRVGVVRVRNR